MNLADITSLLSLLPLLSLCWVLPVGGALLEGIAARRGAAGTLFVPVSLLSLAAAVAVFLVFDAHGAGALVEARPLIPALIPALTWLHLGPRAAIDGIGALFLPLAALLGVLISLFGERAWTQRQGWQAAALLLQGCLQGMAVSEDLLQFCFFFTLEIVPCHLLIRDYGVTADPLERLAAARKVTLFLLFSAALFLAGTLLLGWEHLQIVGAWSTDRPDLIGLPLQRAELIFVLLFLAVAIRTPVFPFHGWMIAALEHGPVVGLNVFLLGVKIGILSLLRDVLPLLPEQAAHWAPQVSVLGIAGLLYGALLALIQEKLRRVLAFITLSHMGYIVPALFTLNRFGMEGAVVEALNLGIAAAGLYFAAGFLTLRAGSTDFARLQQITPAMPRLAMAFLIIVLTSLGMPGTLGFEALHLVLEGALLARSWSAALLVGIGTVISAGCLLWNYQRLFLIRPEVPQAGAPILAPVLSPGRGLPPGPIRDLDRTELFISAVVCSLVITGQSSHHPVLTFVGPVVERLIGQMEAP